LRNAFRQKRLGMLRSNLFMQDIITSSHFLTMRAFWALKRF